MAVFSPSALPLVAPRPRLPRLVLPAGPARVALALVAVFLLALLGSAVSGRGAASAPPQSVLPGPAESVAYPAWTVESGQTLWSIARAVSPEADPRAVVLQLRVLNGLGPGHVLQPGEVLQVPAAPAG